MKLLNGDCLELLKDISDNSVDLVVTDPPYDVHAGKGGGAFGDRDMFSQIENISDGFNEQILHEICRVLKKMKLKFPISQIQVLRKLSLEFQQATK